jgi:uncharacterized membrane protein
MAQKQLQFFRVASLENVVNPVAGGIYFNLADKTINAVENFINTNDHVNEHTKEEIKINKNNALLCYIPLVVFYFIFTGKYKKSNYLHFHANQGLNVTLCYLASIFVSELLRALFKREGFVLNTTPGWVSFISYILYCICFLLTLFGVINTVNESSKELPVIGKLNLLK